MFFCEFFLSTDLYWLYKLDKRSHLNLLLWNCWTKLKQIWLGWSPFNIVSDSPALLSKWLLLLKIEISLVVNFHFKMNSNFNCSYMAMSSLTYILGFCEIFSASLFRLGILWDKNHIKIFCTEIWVEIIFGWPTFKIMCNAPIFYQL